MTVGLPAGGGAAASDLGAREGDASDANAAGRPFLAVALAVALAAGLLAQAVRNLGYRGMWWDEASQFWVSQGVGRYAEPFTPRQGLAEVARRNAWDNLDPGGFSLLLHGWTLVSRGLVWLRLLPFVFFLAGSLALALLGWRLTRSALFAVAAGAVPSLFPSALYFALEIRAYSMEMAGIAIGALLLVLAIERPSSGRAVLLGLACAAFMTSRYSFVLTAAALLVALWSGSAGRISGRALRVQMVAAALPSAVVGAAIAGIMLPHQLWPEMHGGALGLSSPVYTHGGVLRFAPNVPALLVRNLVSPVALPITLAIVVVVVVWARRIAARPGHVQADPAAGLPAARFAVFTFVAVVQALSAVVSLLGLYPWDIASRWSAYLLAVSGVATVALAAEVRGRVLARIAGRADAAARARARRLGAALVALVVVAASVSGALHRQSIEGRWGTDLALQIDRLPPAALGPGRVFVTWYEVPTVRYLYEHGPYVGRPEYPTSFRFETLAEWEAKAPIAATRDGIEFIVTALSLGQAQARFPGCVLRPYDAIGSHLLTVQPAPRIDPPRH